MSARPASPHGPKFSEDEWEAFVRSFLEQGWLPDVVDQIQDDRRDGIERAYVLTINDTARYLGLSRYGVEKLIADGKLRLFTIAPTYRGEKPSRRVPATDVLAVK